MRSFFVEMIFVKSRVKAAGLGTLAAVAAALCLIRAKIMYELTHLSLF